MEANALLSSSKIYRKHGALQESLASATYLLDIAEDCKKVGYPVTAAAQFELADVLWCQGETDTSIRMLQHLLMGEESKQLSADLGLCQTYTKLVR
jgi:serine-protein kinase ATM